MIILSSADFFFAKLTFFSKYLSGSQPECQTVWTKIRPDVSSGLVWVQIVCKDQKTVWKDIADNKKNCTRLNKFLKGTSTLMITLFDVKDLKKHEF